MAPQDLRARCSSRSDHRCLDRSLLYDDSRPISLPRREEASLPVFAAVRDLDCPPLHQARTRCANPQHPAHPPRKLKNPRGHTHAQGHGSDIEMTERTTTPGRLAQLRAVAI
jgi:hypothetical protein